MSVEQMLIGFFRAKEQRTTILHSICGFLISLPQFARFRWQRGSPQWRGRLCLPTAMAEWRSLPEGEIAAED